MTKFKLSLATQEEANAAQGLYTLADDVRVTVHYDATSRNNIDGEWPSLILVFSESRRFRLRPLSFAYEDRQNIVRLFVETFERCRTTDVVTTQTLSSSVSNVMTDAAIRNLGFEKEVSKLRTSKSLRTIYSVLSRRRVVVRRSASNPLHLYELGIDF